MSTRSTIAMTGPDGLIRSIYCHSDGYLAHVGEVLFKHYWDPDKIAALIALGGLSCLYRFLEPPQGEKHDFDRPRGEVTIAYHRDRGDPVRIQEHADLKSFRRTMREHGFSYTYHFHEGAWWVLVAGGEWDLLSEALEEDRLLRKERGP